MSQKNIKWTPDQRQAIEEHQRSVFVSASAGTGKTAVLSGSCVDVVMNTSACPDVWSILVLTFTDMAAEQMRSRIAQQLYLAIEASKDAILGRHLRRQLILLGAADISTIHSFCKRLITEHFYGLDIDPTFRVIDADEAKLLKAEVLEKTLDYAWKQNNLADALRQLLARRNLRPNDGFPSVIIEISDFLDCIVSRDDWLRRAQILAETTDPFATDLAQSQKQIIEEKLQDAFSRLEFALKIYQANSPKGQWAQICSREYISPVRQCLEWFKAGRWETASSALIAYQKPTVFRPKDTPEIADSIKAIVDDAIKTVANLKDLAILNPDYLSRLAGAVSSQTLVLVELVRRFDEFYRQAKKSINCLDFADLEHNALHLLTTEEKRGQEFFSLKPSQTALKLREKYKYIFVDECQDINSVQQMLLDMISKQDNIFAVGDPKQSIYQWRGANPDIFIENLKKASVQRTGNLGLRVDLNVNFRSVKPILDFVNLVFSRIMTSSFAGLDYDQSAHLKPAEQIKPNAGPAVELHILDKPQKNNEREDIEENQADNESTQQFTGRQLQAALIAQRIKQIVGAETGKPEISIFDKTINGSRPAEYRDVVILMRSLAGRNDFIEVLRLSGIPVSCEATAGYFQATEITDMLSLLKVLDNPRRDIDFAAVLRSPMFCLTDTDLAKVRLWGKMNNDNFSFYDCVLGCGRSQDDAELAEKLTHALASLDNWRTLARRGRLAELIWHIYRRTGLLSFVCALPQGDARRANLLKLHDRAIQFEGFVSGAGVPSLTRFIDFVEKLLAAGQDWAPAEPESAAGNAVRVLSVHKSKGLEFPVVFLAELDNLFNRKDSRRDCLLDENLGLGFQIIDTESNSRLDTLAYQVIEQQKRRKSLAEEMRILYVAMTRAVNRLILVGCKDVKSCQRTLGSAFFFEDGPLPGWYLDSCNSHLDWILCALGREPLLHQAFQTAIQTPPVGDNLFSVQLYDYPELEKLSAFIRNSKLYPPSVWRVKTKNSKFNSQSGAYDLAGLKQSLSWHYPFGNAPLLPAKRSVTQFTHRNDEFAKRDYSMALGRMPKIVLQTQQVDGLSLGTAAHLVISQLDLNHPITEEAIKRVINKLVADGVIVEPVASLVDTGSIVEFFETDLGQAALDKNNKCWREWPFTYAVSASEWSVSEPFSPHPCGGGHCEAEGRSNLTSHEPRATSNDSIIVQGIIDLLIKTPEGLMVIDFKNDDIPADQVPRRVELYRQQLEIYAGAAEAITGEKVKAKWLYFLKPRCKVDVRA